MDILAQYEKENPKSKGSSQSIHEDILEDFGPIIQWIRKISGGRIQDIKQINMLLVAFSIMVILAALFIFLTSSPSIELPPPSPYRGVQGS